MGTEYIPTAKSWLESLAKLLAHQNGGMVENLLIVKKEGKGQEPA